MFEFAGLAETETNELGDPDIVSVIGKQDENRVQEYQTEAGDKLEILYMGSFTAKVILFGLYLCMPPCRSPLCNDMLPNTNVFIGVP